MFPVFTRVDVHNIVSVRVVGLGWVSRVLIHTILSVEQVNNVWFAVYLSDLDLFLIRINEKEVCAGYTKKVLWNALDVKWDADPDSVILVYIAE